MKAQYEIVVVENNRTIVYMVAYSKQQAKQFQTMLREQYPDCAVQVYELESEAV